MKYWLLTSEYPPFFGGGIGTYCAITARMMADNRHQVTVFVSDASVSDVSIQQQDHIRIIRFNTSRTNSSAFLGHVTNISFEFAQVIKEFIEKEGKPDCIEAQEYLGIAYYLLQFKLLLYDWCKDVPIVITMHSPSFLYMEYNHVPMYRYPNYWICEMERFCLQAADQIISPSQFMIEELDKRFKLDNRNLEIVPNPFEPKTLLNIDAAAEYESPDQIVFFGKLTAQKGAFRLMNYFQNLWNSGFSRPLYLIGGQEIIYHPEGISMGDIIRKKYRKYIEQGFLKMEGQLKPSEIANRLANAQVVIVPSDNDNLPYVVFEMMTLGKILLVSKQGGQREVIENGKDGFIFDHNDPKTFDDQLNRILNLSKPERETISKAAIKKIRDKYYPVHIYEKKLKVINRLIASRNQPRTKFPFIRHLEIIISNEPALDCKQGLLSIIIPYFNMGDYIEETIGSLEKITCNLKEIIIINDGSSEEKSIAKLEQFRLKQHIHVIDIANGGLANARNMGARTANGEFLAFLDADDKVSPDYYEKAIKIFTQYDNVHFAGCWGQYFGDSKRVSPTFTPEPPLILYHNLTNSSSLVYRRKSFLLGGLNDSEMIFPGLEDYESVISMVGNGLGGVMIPERAFQYRIRSNSMIRDISRSKKLYLYQHISEKHKKFYANFAADLFNLLNANGPGIIMDNPTLDYHLADKLPFGGKLSNQVISLIKKNKFVKTIAYKAYKLLKK